MKAGAESESAYVAVINPANNFLQHFQQALAAEGIPVKQALLASISRNFTQELATVESPPLAELVKKKLIGKATMFMQRFYYDCWEKTADACSTRGYN